MASFMNTDIDYIGYKNIALFKVSDIQQHCVIKVDTFRIYIFKIAQKPYHDNCGKILQPE